jgi:gluconokinase
MNHRPHVLLMGVSGVGKTRIGRLLAKRLGVGFLDADELHSPDSLQKMRSGKPLDDSDRMPWLDRVRSAMEDRAIDTPLVVACSALKAAYRARLGPELFRLVYLSGEPTLIATRLEQRRDHFMPPELLQSQLAILEPPDDAITIDIDATPKRIVDEIMRHLSRHQ